VKHGVQGVDEVVKNVQRAVRSLEHHHQLLPEAVGSVSEPQLNNTGGGSGRAPWLVHSNIGEGVTGDIGGPKSHKGSQAGRQIAVQLRVGKVPSHYLSRCEPLYGAVRGGGTWPQAQLFSERVGVPQIRRRKRSQRNKPSASRTLGRRGG
jgi:hypothetical protein